MVKGIILAGGNGSRLYPVTNGISKHLLPIHDKPMIYHPLSVLMLSGIRDILIITKQDDLESYQRLLGTGEKFGISISYANQEKPEGLAQAFIIGEDFIGNDSVCLVLGDNIFYGNGLRPRLVNVSQKKSGATVFGYQVKAPERFGVINFDEDMRAVSIEEKPKNPKSNYALTGLYFYDNQVIDIAKQVRPSPRGELEISCINQFYLENNSLDVEILGRGFTWFDAGTIESLLEATHLVETMEKIQGYKIACLEEIAFNSGWLSIDKLSEAAHAMRNSNYGEYLADLVMDANNGSR